MSWSTAPWFKLSSLSPLIKSWQFREVSETGPTWRGSESRSLSLRDPRLRLQEPDSSDHALRAHRDADFPALARRAQARRKHLSTILQKAPRKGKGEMNYHNAKGFKQPSQIKLVNHRLGARPREVALYLADSQRSLHHGSLHRPPRYRARAPLRERGHPPCAPAHPGAPRPPSRRRPAGVLPAGLASSGGSWGPLPLASYWGTVDLLAWKSVLTGGLDEPALP